MEDLIKRQAAIDILKKLSDGSSYIEIETNSAIKVFEEMPPAQYETSPKISEILDYLDTTLHPLVSPEHWDVYATLHDMISLLGLERPAQRAGRWIYCSDNVATCSECGNRRGLYRRINYCPNCGAYMVTEEEM